MGRGSVLRTILGFLPGVLRPGAGARNALVIKIVIYIPRNYSKVPRVPSMAAAGLARLTWFIAPSLARRIPSVRYFFYDPF